MNIFRTLTIVLVALLVSGFVARAEPALYRITDADTSIYLLGTVHLLRPETQWRSERVDEAITQSDAVYFEADVLNADPQVMQALIIEHGLMPYGETLPSLLTKEEWAAVSAYSTRLGMPPEGLQTMRPWLAAVTLVTMDAISEGFDPNAGVDAIIYREMETEGMELRFFETVEQQTRFLADLPNDIQTQMLMETVAHADTNHQQFEMMLEIWLEGDLDRLDEIVNGGMRTDYPDVYEALIVGRNQKWVAELSTLMETPGSYFVAVGALHLPGEDGVVMLMAEEGFTVERQ